MPDLTNDQRLSGNLLPLLSELQQSTDRHGQNANVLLEHGSEEAGHVQRIAEARASEQADRLAEIVEALAAGTLRIVDENAVVRVLAGEFSGPSKAPDSTSRAQLVLERLQFRGALR